jgi:uncharacterized membrane protein YeaQ/YmgE (transglycosylase-associated protein family)
MLTLIVWLLIIGLIAGALARLLVPGRDPIGIGGTIVLGIVGSFIGGFLGFLIYGHDKGDGFVQPSGVIGSVIGSVIALLIYRRIGGRRSVRA